MIKSTFYIFIIISNLFCISLQEAYNAAEPNGNYDKYLILDSETVYTGGLGIYEGDVFIDCNSAVIDLPLPDSPSKTNVSPRRMSNEILSTILIFPAPEPVEAVRFLTCNKFLVITISHRCSVIYVVFYFHQVRHKLILLQLL